MLWAIALRQNGAGKHDGPMIVASVAAPPRSAQPSVPAGFGKAPKSDEQRRREGSREIQAARGQR